MTSVAQRSLGNVLKDPLPGDEKLDVLADVTGYSIQ